LISNQRISRIELITFHVHTVV